MDTTAPAMKPRPLSGIAAVDHYLDGGYEQVVGMSGRFAAAMAGQMMRLQTEAGVGGAFAEIGAFEGRFFIAMAHALAPGERALGMDVFNWPNEGVEGRFNANCDRHGIGPDRRTSWKIDSGTTVPEALLEKLGGQRVRLFHIDGDHSQAALTHDLKLANATMADGGLIVLDDMLHPGYPTLMIAVDAFLKRHADWTVLAVIDRETIVAATKFVLCQTSWFKRYEAGLLETAKDYVWPMGADFEPHWCLVLSLDTRLAPIV
jgi:hypothetical protein